MKPFSSSEFSICDTAPLVTERNCPISVGLTFEGLSTELPSTALSNMNSARLMSCFPSIGLIPKPELASFLNLKMVRRSSMRSSSPFAPPVLSAIEPFRLILL